MIVMRYMAIAESDAGMKDVNQDGIFLKHTLSGNREVLIAIICDGIGGLSKGEIASAMVIKAFQEWFSAEMSNELKHVDMDVIGNKWALLLKSLNCRIQEYGQEVGEKMGTTFTGVLFVDDQFVLVHVGDTRLYYIGKSLEQMTCDHTYVAREVMLGNLTQEEARTNKYRNMLLQCVGASRKVEPQIVSGSVRQGVYMLCSDGFRHKITEREIFENFVFERLKNQKTMKKQCQYLIDLNKQREEKDNISVILIKSFGRKYTSLGQKIFFIKKWLLD